MALNIDSSWMKLAHWLTDDTAKEISHNFSTAFNAAKERGQQGKEFDARMAENKRQFDILNPAFPTQWPGGASARAQGGPAWMGRSDAMMNGPQGGRPAVAAPASVPSTSGGFQDFIKSAVQYGGAAGAAEAMVAGEPPTNWTPPGNTWNPPRNGDAPAQPAWMKAGLNFSDPMSGVAAVAVSRTLGEAHSVLEKIYAEHPEMVANKAFQSAVDKKLANIGAMEAKDVALQRAKNGSYEERQKLLDHASFLKRLGAIDEKSRSFIQGMEKNKDGTISHLALDALDTAEIATRQAREAEMAARAKQDGQVVTGYNQKTGERIYGRPFASAGGANAADLEVRTLPDEQGQAAFQVVADKNTGKPVGSPRALTATAPADVKALQAINKTQMAAAQREVDRHLNVLSSPQIVPMATKEASRKALPAAEANLKKLRDESVRLSTNFPNRASAPKNGTETTKGTKVPDPKDVKHPSVEVTLPQATSTVDKEEAIRQANLAINGYTNRDGVFVPPKPKAAVLERLKAMGITLKEEKQ